MWIEINDTLINLDSIKRIEKPDFKDLWCYYKYTTKGDFAKKFSFKTNADALETYELLKSKLLLCKVGGNKFLG
jgi:hypothetical protein